MTGAFGSPFHKSNLERCNALAQFSTTTQTIQQHSINQKRRFLGLHKPYKENTIKLNTRHLTILTKNVLICSENIVLRRFLAGDVNQELI
ncbi:hypothetical protein QFZ20_004986 [Flavobacterium sp. W4I14]|nr:hypothetical protein [Flavobacterium sp. W4I14]